VQAVVAGTGHTARSHADQPAGVERAGRPQMKLSTHAFTQTRHHPPAATAVTNFMGADAAESPATRLTWVRPLSAGETPCAFEVSLVVLGEVLFE
jgi:hypothetical protein